jgi:mRNA interferase MazF
MTSSATTEAVQRGDVVIIADRQAEFAGKPRPAIVLQSSHFADTTTVTVCPLTSQAIDDAPLLRIALAASAATGLDVDSWAQIDRLTTLRRSHIRQRIGRLDSATMFEISQAVLVFLGIADAAGH